MDADIALVCGIHHDRGMRRFGLTAVDPLPGSTHIVHFYQHGKDLLEVYAQFCCAGLQDGDCCFWVTAPPWTTGLALHELRKRLPTIDQYTESGQLHLLPSEELYLVRDTLDVDGTLEKAMRHLQEARRQGWLRIRACGSPCRGGSEREWSACVQYEQQMHRIITDLDILALCAYRLSGLSDQAKRGLLQSHDMALEREDDGWRYGPTEGDIPPSVLV